MATKTGEIITLRQELTKVRDEAQRVKRELYFAGTGFIMQLVVVRFIINNAVYECLTSIMWTVPT